MHQDEDHVPMPPMAQTNILTTPPDLLQLHNLPLNLNLAIEFDGGALQPHQRDRLLGLLQADRLSDKDYLRSHPEVQAFVNLIFRSLIETQPESIFDHLGQFFSQPQFELKLAVQRELDEIRLPRNTEPVESAGESQATTESYLDEEDHSGSTKSRPLSKCWGSLDSV